MLSIALSKHSSKVLWQFLSLPVLTGALVGAIALDLRLSSGVRAQTTGTTPATTAATTPQRPRYRFFEEERRIRTPTPTEEREDRALRSSTGFNATFLQDAINGNQDPGALVGNNPSVEDNRGPGFSKGTVNAQSPQIPGPSISGSFGIFQTAP
ncbi:hypothetical protein [Pseudanabaena sp. PCC 6802]|uniref:hypothetical protein n=1 Tax=Pseudanabaena sp. PCC 6802 TaxID=118173 RepID=UPI00034D65FA|nr:hypothetical protein [Pseudanabaena sp. PCC 6802]